MAKTKPTFTRHNLTFVSTEGMDRSVWLEKRQAGLGGSDISSVMGLNHHFSAIELFYQKIGMTFSNQEELNDAMFFGNQLERTVLNIGQYYDVNTGQYLDNFSTGTRLRKITALKYMVHNPDYPWIIANLDGAVNFTPRNFMMDGPAEAKTISRQTAEMWLDRLPPYHLTQIMTYCTVCKPMMREDAAHIFYLEDGRTYRGFHVPVSESIRDQILTRGEAFWNRVVKGREIVAEVKNIDKRLHFLAQIEPAADDTEVYAQFLSELFKLKTTFQTIEGSEDDIFNAKEYKRLGAEAKAVKSQRQLYSNKIKKSLHENSANIILLGQNGSEGKITFNKKLYVNLKGVASDGEDLDE